MKSKHPGASSALPILFIDADDTLWENSIWYQQATEEFAELPELRHLTRAEVAVEVERRDRFGYGEQAFTHALICTYQDLVGHPCRSREAQLRTLGQVSRRSLLLREGVVQTLQSLCWHYRLILVTKGKHQEQEHKLLRSGLQHFFWAVRVVQKKNVALYEHLIKEFGVERTSTWMIGDAVASDINPALQAGLRALFLPNKHTWSRECAPLLQPEAGQLLTVPHFWQLEEVLAGEPTRQSNYSPSSAGGFLQQIEPGDKRGSNQGEFDTHLSVRKQEGRNNENHARSGL